MMPLTCMDTWTVHGLHALRHTDHIAEFVQDWLTAQLATSHAYIQLSHYLQQNLSLWKQNKEVVSSSSSELSCKTATIAYEDNDACTAMANSRKPMARTRHIGTKYHVICEWVERDLIKLERVNTTQNMADHFTKQLTPALFHCHVDYILGHVPPPYSPYFKQLCGQYKRYKEDKLLHNKPPAICLPPTNPNTIDTHIPTTAAAAKFIISWARILDSLG